MNWRGPTWIREGAIVLLWAASAANVAIYVLKTLKETAKPASLADWTATVNGTPKGKGKAKSESLEEEVLEGAGTVLENLNPLNLPGGKLNPLNSLNPLN